MALDKKNLIELARVVAKADSNSPTAYSFGEKKYSYDELDSTLRAELKELVGTPQLYRENKGTLFTLIEETITEVLPKRVLEQYGMFADIRTFDDGEKAIFSIKTSNYAKQRGKKFVTKVGLAGVYEVFKLDGYTLEVPVEAWGGAAQIGFEEYLEGRIDMADVIGIINDGLNEAVYREIAKALKSAINSIQPTNIDSQTGFVESSMDNLLQIADSYGKATIYCTYEFAALMVPQSGWISDEQRNAKWNTGYLANYKGHNVVILPQSYEDASNTKKVIDPSYAYIIPTGADKPIKVAFEGGVHTKEVENQDWSTEIRAYQKFGVGMVGINSGICVYQNSNLAPAAKTLVLNAAPGLDAVYTP
jgi:hypothetical protein